MFENKRDTMLFQGALLSAASANSGSLLNCEAASDALNIICHSVKKIVSHNLKSIKDEKERMQIQLYVNKRLHAAMFFTALKSYNLTSNSADAFYSSVIGWPPIDLKFYIELSYRCDWSEYFIDCVSQLQTELLIKVLKLILSIQFSSEVEKYCWHLILQTLIMKLVEAPGSNRVESAFNFGFSEKKCKEDQVENIEKSEGISDDFLLKKSLEEVAVLKDFYNEMWNRISSEIIKSNNIDIMKILLHAVKTILRNFLLEKQRNYENTAKFNDFIEIFNSLNDCLKSDSCKELLKIALSKSAVPVSKHSCAVLSWNISESYLSFLLTYYSNKIHSEFYFINDLPSNCLKFYSEIRPSMLSYEEVNVLNPLLADCSEMENANLNVLHDILMMNFEGASCVPKIFFSKPDFLERNNTLRILEDYSHVIDFKETYSSIILCAKNVTNCDLKYRLLNIFYKLLRKENTSVCNDVIEAILSQYGFTEEFELPNFSEQLSLCFRSAPTIKEAEEIFPVLFVQNPLILLKLVIDQTLIQGIDGEPFIRPLKYVSFVCTYQENKNALPTLIRILNGYFEKNKLEPWETKNMVVLYKFLMKLQAEKIPIIVLDVFFNIMHNSKVTS